MAVIQTFRDLKVYAKATAAAHEIFLLSQKFPSDERYSLTDQIRRSSRAVTAMLAEAWARRRYQAAFINKINEALGEAMETQAWLDHARGCEYLNQVEFSQQDQNWREIGGMLQNMIRKAETFAKNSSA